jgi:tRNA-dihydrouridine synthase B
MVTSDISLWHSKKSSHRLVHRDEPGIAWVQLAGSDPSMMAEAARANVDMGADIIDINMGCPAKKVCRKAAGSALLRDESLVAEILEAVVGASSVPVTLKMRLGWSRQEMNAVAISRIAESAGIQLLTIHGRTRACRFGGVVDYAAIGEVKADVSIPVIANGDIDSGEKAKSVLRETGADGVMIGRGAQGKPWLPAGIDYFLKTGELLLEPGVEEIGHLLRDHIESLHAFYGEYKGVRIARKHVGWALEKIPGADSLKQQFNRIDCGKEQLSLIDRLALECVPLAA